MRKVHLYLGVFTTPALLFFAFTGAMQTFSLHESTQGSNYKPPAWIATLAQLHKKQDTTVPVHKMRSPMPDKAQGEGERGETVSDRMEHAFDGSGSGLAPSGSAPQTGSSKANKIGVHKTGQSRAGDSAAALQKSHLPMKIFFLLVAASLAVSTLTGIYMSYKYDRGWWQLTGLLLAGLVVPLLLLPF